MVTATNGWMWEIPLTTKTSVGYIYSNKFITKEEAIKELMKEYPEVPYKDIKAISFDPFILDKPWVDNLISIGLGQSFIDPLQSSILLQTRTHLTSLIEALKSPNPLGYVQIDKFNRMCTDHRDAFLAFIELHYRGCIRRDTKYWRYVTSIPHISKGASDFINYGNTYINNRPLDWEKWHILAAGLELIDLSRTYEGSR
jgi:tryptophan halogenase